MSEIDSKIFNTSLANTRPASIFLGDEPGLFDTIDRAHPEIWEIYKNMKSLDWDENEFNYSSCIVDFKTCDPSTYDMMIKTLAWQWEADSIAARSIIGVLAPVISNTEVSAAWMRIADNENVHAATYSEIVRNSFEDPTIIKREIMQVNQSLDRLKTVADVMSKAYRTSHLYALDMVGPNQETYNDIFMFVIALLALERIQFMSSFAVTFAISDTGLFQPIGKAVQKIAQDELEVHVKMDYAVLANELKTERGQIAFEQCRPMVQCVFDEVLNSEMQWVDYLFSEGRELVGLTPKILKEWSQFMARDTYNFFDLKAPMDLPDRNPLKFMEDWLDISKTQASPQEQDNGQYKVNLLRRTDEDEVFDFDF